MDAHQIEPLNLYRQRLLESLRNLPGRQGERSAARLQVFVNQECVGSLQTDASDPSFSFASRERSIHCVELRSEAGILVGGLLAPEIGVRTARLAWSGRLIDLTIQNRTEGGSLRMMYKAVPSLWARFSRSVERVAPDWIGTGVQPSAVQGLLLAQVVLLVAVGYLIVDRVIERGEREAGTSVATAMGREIVSTAQTQDAISRLEEKVNAVLAAQSLSSQAIAGQHKTIVGMQRTVDQLNQQQKQMETQVVSVQQMEEHQERIARQSNLEVERITKVLMGQVQSERVQLRDELHSLSMANEHLAKHVSSMEKKNQELVARLRSAGIEVSARAKDGSEPSMMLAREKSTSESVTTASQSAETRNDAAPLHFFVSFQEGTTEESIDRWFQDLHARKGDADSGWYSVEVPRPAQQPAERFMEGLKSVKIVKAVATTRARHSGR